jgi:hypothetical protein
LRVEEEEEGGKGRRDRKEREEGEDGKAWRVLFSWMLCSHSLSLSLLWS